MPDEESSIDRQWDGVTADEAETARALAGLGPLMLRQEQAEADPPDAAFARGLRARLLAAGPAAANADSLNPAADADSPNPAWGTDLRARLVGGEDGADGEDTRPPIGPAVAPVASPVAERGLISLARARRRGLVVGGVLAALVAALALAVVVLPRARPARQGNPAHVAAGAPRLSATDLTRGYPLPPGSQGGGGGGAGGIPPEKSRLGSPGSAAPYYGPLRLTAGPLPRGDARLPIYRLAPPATADRVGAWARLVGIRARVARVASGIAFWEVAADGVGTPDSRVPLHSLAVSELTGEVVYHDLPPLAPAGAPPARLTPAPAPTKTEAVAVARAWVTRLGWPGGRMHARGVVAGYDEPNSWVVSLGWPGVSATMAAATIEVTPHRRVVEAHLWPQPGQAVQVRARGVPDALARLRGGHIPLAVTELGVYAAYSVPVIGGSGTVGSVTVVYILTADAGGVPYLVPAYRFTGTARLSANPRLYPKGGKGLPPAASPIPARWYALVPAVT